MDVSNITSQIAVPDSSESKRLVVKPEGVVGWDDLRAQVKSQVETQQALDTVTLVKSGSQISETKPEQDPEAAAAAPDETQQESVSGNGQEPGPEGEATGALTALGGNIDKVV